MLPSSYAMNIDGYVLVYSVASRKSFDVVKVIYDKILDMTGKLKLVSSTTYYILPTTICYLLFQVFSLTLWLTIHFDVGHIISISV